MTSRRHERAVRHAARRRLLALAGAGLVDSLFLSMAWTVVILHVSAVHGLLAAGLLSTAMLVGVGLSAPAAGWVSARLDGRRLLRGTAAVEAVLRLGVFALIAADAPLWILAACVAAMNVVAWTGYAGMRAEVAAVGGGARGLTWFGTVVAAVEAAGIAVGAFLPAIGGPGSGPVLAVMATVYALSLVPTAVVAGGSRVPRSAAGVAAGVAVGRRGSRVTPPALGGTLLMFLASAPTLLAIALAAELHGRSAVAAAAVAFTLGSLVAPVLAGRVQARGANGPVVWVLCGVGMVVGWLLAPYSVLLLCVAQVFSGMCMTALEGLLDADAARRRPDQVTAALARATAGRALGSAGGTALLPLLVAAVGLQQGVLAITAVLLLAVPAVLGVRARPAATEPAEGVPVEAVPVGAAQCSGDHARAL